MSSVSKSSREFLHRADPNAYNVYYPCLVEKTSTQRFLLLISDKSASTGITPFLVRPAST
jgi:hypothetical protein